MKYEYGVEYETNGEDPSLDDDIIVEQYSTADNKWHKGRVGSWNWAARTIVKFRIVDERYNPTEKDNTWFERGELPPVGVECELKPYWHKVKIVASHDGKTVYWDLHDQKYDFCYFPDYFRPIRTEREKAIEAAAKIAEEHNKSGAKEFYGALYDAGLLRLQE